MTYKAQRCIISISKYDHVTESVVLVRDALNYRGLPSVDLRPISEWDFFDENGELIDFKWDTEI